VRPRSLQSGPPTNRPRHQPTRFRAKGKLMDRIINIHIPKTGGSTMYQVMYKNVDQKRTLWAGSKHATVIPWFTSISQEERNGYTAVFGHIRYGFHRFFTDGTPRYFT